MSDEDPRRQQLRAAARRLHLAAGEPKLDVLAGYAERRRERSTLGNVTSGPKWPTWGTLDAYIDACIQHAAANSKHLPAELTDKTVWMNLHQAGSRAKGRPSADASPDTAQVADGFLPPATETLAGRAPVAMCDQAVSGSQSTVRPLGWLIRDCDPMTLQVKPAIRATPGARDGAFPTYVQREHDTLLLDVEKEMSAHGRSKMVTLIGESSTGKTRAAWELVQHLERQEPGRWRLWRPRTAVNVQDLDAGWDRIGPDTIVWLDNAQHHLITFDAAGAAVASRLLALLADPGRAPVLVLATIWSCSWRELTAAPDGPGPDVHGQARDLLQASVEIRVPDAFTPDDLQKLREAADSDTLLHRAAERATNGQIVQQLAGVPELERRCENGGSLVRAVVRAAIDARRLDHPQLLPYTFFEHAVPGYLKDLDKDLDPAEWNTLGPTWPLPLDDTLAYLGALANGISGPLSPHTPLPSEGPVPDGRWFRLADHLDERGRTERAADYPPDTFWSALATVVDDPRLLQRLAQHAYTRGRYQHAMWLCWGGIRCGHLPALKIVADWRERDEGPDGPEIVYRQAAELGNSDAVWLLGQCREEAGEQGLADMLYDYAASHDSPGAIRELARRHRRSGDLGAAEASYQRAARLGDPDALTGLALMWQTTGDPESAEALAVHATRLGHPWVALHLAEFREGQDDLAGAYCLYNTAAQAMNNDHVWERTHWIGAKAGGDVYGRSLAVDRTDYSAVERLQNIPIPDKPDHSLETEVFFQKISSAHEIYELTMSARNYVRAGDMEGALAVYRPARERGLATAATHAGNIYERFGHIEQAKKLFLEALNRGDHQAINNLDALLRQTSDPSHSDRMLDVGLTSHGKPANRLDLDRPVFLPPVINLQDILTAAATAWQSSNAAALDSAPPLGLM